MPLPCLILKADFANGHSYDLTPFARPVTADR
jgi:hypothetical protein